MGILAETSMSDIDIRLEDGGVRITVTESTGNKYTKRASILLNADASFHGCDFETAKALIKMIDAAADY